MSSRYKWLMTALIIIANLPISANDKALQIAERFITSFYSWDQNALNALLTEDGDHQSIIYYQGWAEGGNYSIKTRRPCVMNKDAVSCSITVTDDFGLALGYIATDTFILKISNGQVTEVTFTADDPPIFDKLLNWIRNERDHILTGPCLDMFAGGLTPKICAKTVAKSAEEFMRIEVLKQ